MLNTHWAQPPEVRLDVSQDHTLVRKLFVEITNPVRRTVIFT